MVIIEHLSIKNIPYLHVVKKDYSTEKLPLVIFVHGFTSAKENNLHYAYLLADKGFRVILPEALHHGERAKGLSEKELYTHFWSIVIQTIKELPELKEFYLEKGLADPNRIGLAGTSMGGIITLGALTQYHWVRAAVSLMGMPSYEKFSLWQIDQLQSQGIQLPITNNQIQEQLAVLREFDLSLQPEKINKRPLLFWHGKKDPVVPYHLTYHFYQTLMESSGGYTKHIKFITDEHADHKVSREGTAAAVDWFQKYL